MEDMMKTCKSPQDAGLLIQSVTQTVESETKEQKGEFLNMLLCILSASLLGNLLAGKGATAKSQTQGQRTIRAVQGFQ